ncbi:MAG: response regulator transcription factor [Bdellovibrio sp.]|nr:response regulator transcription factor [Bdellovibrio sp.]
MHLLIVDDDQKLCQTLKNTLSDLGEVAWADSCADAKKIFHERGADLLIADYFLPDGNGLALIQEVKLKNPSLKSILMSAATTKDIAIASVNMQISALIEKPFLGSELRCLIAGLFIHDSIILNERDHLVTIREIKFSLTPTEFKIFKLLYTQPDQRLTRKVICEKIWGAVEISENTFDTHLGNLKKKMSHYSDLLTNVKGVGYSLSRLDC